MCLNGGVFVVAALGRASSYNAECEKYLAQQHYIAQSLQSDAQTVYARRPQAAARLAESYARSYGPAAVSYTNLDVYKRQAQGFVVLHQQNAHVRSLPAMI